MGAKNIGDIKEICDLVHPKLAILTAIGPQHLDTFKTLENVRRTKMELIDSLPEDGIAVVNYEDENIRETQIDKNYIKFGFDSSNDIYADNIEMSEDGSIFEAVEVKHMIPISKEIIDSAKQKIRGSQVDRYYILTTHQQHEPSKEVIDEVENVKRLLGCQMIVNGVIPSLKYYLRLLTNPGSVLPYYAKELEADTAIGFEHRDIWNKIATGDLK